MHRISKRRTSKEGSFEDFLRAEFRTKNGELDTSLSVYEAECEKFSQMHAEHHAACGLEPPPYCGHFDTEGSAGVIQLDPGSPVFRFTHEQHRVLSFADESDLLAFARKIHAALPESRVNTSRALVAKHVVQCLDDQANPEWRQYCADTSHKHGSKWETWARNNAR